MTVYIVDKNPLIRAEISAVFCKLPYDLKIVQINSVDEMLSCVYEHGMPSLISMEIDDIEIKKIKTLKFSYPKVVIVVFSKLAAEEYGGVAMQMGATLFMEKNCEESELEFYFRSIASCIYVKKQKVLDFNKKQKFSKRQTQILTLINKGLTNEQIGVYLNINSGTVKVHIHRLFKSIDVNNRIQAILYAKKHNEKFIDSVEFSELTRFRK
jgi:DNA-binding NarL/FixJ family response regulator